MTRIGLAVVGALALALPSLAKDFYVSQNASGTTNSLAWLNNSANWGTGISQVSPGDTVHFVGVLTNTLSVLGNGTPGSPITFHFEPGAKFSAATLPENSIWITIDGRHDLVFDGGLIECTDNGTAVANGGTHVYSNGGLNGIRGTGLNNITVQNMTISNLFDRQINTDLVQGQGDGSGLYFIGSTIVVSNCFITGCQDSIDQVYLTVPTSNLTVTATTMSNYNHAITVGSGGQTNPIFLNLTITHNTFQSGDSFESKDGVDYGLHRNAIFLFNESELQAGSGQHTSGYISNILIAFNYIRHGTNPKSSTAGSGGMFFDTYNNAATVHVRVYNNISTLAAPLSWSGGGGCASGFGTDVLFANNTIIGWQTNGTWGGGYAWSISGTNAYAFNNLSISSKGTFFSTEAVTTGLAINNATCSSLLSGVWSDYNVYNGINGYSGWINVIYGHDNGGTWQEGFYDTLSQFQTMFSGLLTSHVEPHGTTAPASLDQNFVPLSTDTVARGQGTNLSSFFTTDYYGNPRPATGPWTIGAFEAGPGGSGNSLAVSPPTQNCGTVSVGTSNTVAFTVQNTGSAALTGSASVGAPFIILSGSPYNLPVGQTQTVSVAYSPTIAGTNTQTVNFSGGAAVLATATVSGIAISTNSSSTNLPSTGTVMPASSGSFSAPFVLTNGYIYQPVATTVTNGGVATYSFSCSNAGNYVIQALVNAPSDANNSFYLNIDAMPQDPTMIWDMPITSGFQKELVSWRGNGTDTNNQFVPMVFSLTQGQHQVIIVGRESNVELQNLAVLPLPLPPQNLRILAVGP